MNPTLRKLSKQDLSRAEMADLLEKHIGPGANPLHCDSALEALKRVHDARTSAAIQVLARLTRSHDDPCHAIREIIDLLRNGDFEASSTKLTTPNTERVK